MKWPIQYFNTTCLCNERFGGVDCGECSYAYNDGTTECTKKTILPRKSVSNIDWNKYREALKTVKTSPSRYMVVTAEFTTDLQALVNSMVRPMTYDLFTWMHHIVAKDNEKTKDTNLVDFAHEGPGFPTWHRLFLLWLEREIQVLIEDHEFRLPYWDWTDPEQREILFREDRLGENMDGNVVGELFGNQENYIWPTFCWEDIPDQTPYPIAICNPVTPTGQNLRRCPNATLCSKTNTNWPSEEDVNKAVSIKSYDASPYDKLVTGTDKSFRNLMEGFNVTPGSDCGSDTMCTFDRSTDVTYTVSRNIHNSVHIILGIGDLRSDFPFVKKGVMADVAASPNDPSFINHHAMIDCIFEQWIQENKDNLVYPESDEIREGHRADGYIVPIIPLYMQKQMLKSADNFGYMCGESNTNPTNPSSTITNLSNTMIIVTAVIMVILVVGGGY